MRNEKCEMRNEEFKLKVNLRFRGQSPRGGLGQFAICMSHFSFCISHFAIPFPVLASFAATPSP